MNPPSSERDRLKRVLEAWAKNLRERNLRRESSKRASINSSRLARQASKPSSDLGREVRALQEALDNIPSRVEPLPLDVLDLPTRVINALAKDALGRGKETLSFKDLKELGADGLAALKDIGVTSIRALRSEIVNEIQKPSESILEPSKITSSDAADESRQATHQLASSDAPPSLDELWFDVLRAAQATEGQTTRDLEIIVARNGLRDGGRQTLEEVGQRFGVTRERVRQREAGIVRRLRHATYTAFRKANDLMRVHLESHYVASIDAVIGQATVRDVDLRGMARLVTRVSGDTLDIVAGFWIAHRGGLPPKITRLFSDAAMGLPAQMGWKEAADIGRNLLRAPDLTDETAVGLVVIGFPAEVVLGSDGKPAGIRHRAVDLGEAAYIVLHEAGGPLTLRQMGERVLARFRKWSSQLIVQKIGTAMQNDYRFVHVGNGAYDLSNRFPIAAVEQKAILDTAREVLRRLGKPTDTFFLLRKIRQRIDVSRAVNPYSLCWMLRGDERFLILHRLHVGLREWEASAPDAPFAEALVSVLEEAGTPLNQREVHKRLLDTRSPQLYGVNQGLKRLASQGRILKVAPQTYAALSALQVSASASAAIKAGLERYVADCGLPVVARFLRDSLVQHGSAISNLSDAQLDYVLGTDKRLARIGYGVYVPIDISEAWLKEPISAHATHLLEARNEPVQRVELLWTLQEAHQLEGGQVWEKLLAASGMQLYPFGYIGLRKWGTQGWRSALELVWDRVIAEFKTAREELPDWLTSEAAEALRDLARARGESWLLERMGHEPSVQSRGVAETTLRVGPGNEATANWRPDSRETVDDRFGSDPRGEIDA